MARPEVKIAVLKRGSPEVIFDGSVSLSPKGTDGIRPVSFVLEGIKEQRNVDRTRNLVCWSTGLVFSM